MKGKIVVLSGAGISAESGLATFRDAGGLWEGHKIEDVATPEAWRRNKELVLDFYNQRRKAALNAQPNAGHLALAALEKKYEVVILTQNVDNLHEKAGSSNIVHLHGELFKSRSTQDEHLVYEIEGWELKLGDKCEKGSQLRPHIVWFGEAVPMMDRAIKEVMQADIFIVVGTSLQVYPVAGLISYVPETSIKYIVDPNLPELSYYPNLVFIREKAAQGLPELCEKLLS
ncbi:MAG TPA: NAD-dependent deacylase [Cytophagaceae bacterium]|nr:NAD-dependent deacylase [Cytophagaceae bacterium]